MYHIPSESRVIKTTRELKQWALPTLLSKNPQPSEIEPLGAFRVQRDPQPDVIGNQVAVPDTVPTHADGVSTLGWTVRNKTPEELFDALPYKTATEAKLVMTAWINRLTGQIQNEYPSVVQKGWEEEEAMARAFVADTMTQAQTDTLANDAAAKGRTSAEHATRIIEKADAFRAIAAQTRTLWLATDKALDEATDPAQYPAILQAAIDQAAPLAAAYGLTT